MSIFGGKEQNEALHTELARIEALSLEQLAIETMHKGFGPGGPADGGMAELGAIAGAFNPASGMFLDEDALVEMAQIVAEGVQVLEHAGLVRLVPSASGGGVYHFFYTATRRGRHALEQGELERILAPA